MSIRINGFHHLAVNTADMKAQIEFFTDVLGAELVGLFWMHGVPEGRHCFLRLDDGVSMSFVELAANHAIDPQLGVTHAGTAAGASAPGTMQHLAFNVDGVDELLAIRDRIRSRGINVIGRIDHGMCQSIYFAGPEGLTLEIATTTGGIDPDAWIDPEVVEVCGITAEELERYTHPAGYAGEGGAVPQPPIDPGTPRLAYPPEEYERIIRTPDQVIFERASYPDPPVQPAAGR